MGAGATKKQAAHEDDDAVQQNFRLNRTADVYMRTTTDGSHDRPVPMMRVSTGKAARARQMELSPNAKVDEALYSKYAAQTPTLYMDTASLTAQPLAIEAGTTRRHSRTEIGTALQLSLAAAGGIVALDDGDADGSAAPDSNKIQQMQLADGAATGQSADSFLPNDKTKAVVASSAGQAGQMGVGAATKSGLARSATAKLMDSTPSMPSAGGLFGSLF
eukprot:TRINITY_DN1925_c0_g2_i1.p1 TRINITY_DN1925_c0_g2~~TRINITY_DN1925_c0_g2_i1.p1  ORF type:complete len:230 (+),score=45.43 TRINITY_DN1925_c0_g2_i1:38-691(+)